MQQLLKALELFKTEDLTYEALGDFIFSYDFSKIDYKSYLPDLPEGNEYSRNIITMDPLEVVLLNWPAGVESAVHYHNGFWGYAAVIDGIGKDVVYTRNNGTLTEDKISICNSLGVILEPDQTIHKIANQDENKQLVTLHFYYPPLESLEDMEIYDLERGRIGVLSAEAKSASWVDNDEQFKEIKEDAFEFKSFKESNADASHQMILLKPKPDSRTIRSMIINYYDEQAKEYDNFDTRHESRNRYTLMINNLVGEDLKKIANVKSLLQLACGTGRRSLEVKEISGIDLDITGVDMSPGMTKIAESHGLHIINADWIDASLEDDVTFDSAVMLYAFGHLATEAERNAFLLKLNKHLVMNAPFYLDAFNLEDVYEWGPKVKAAYQRDQLHRSGYQQGDIFYKKVDGTHLSFLHYFTEEEITALLERAGFEVVELKYVGYTKLSGEIVKDKSEGFYYIKANKVRDMV
ncbi:MAG: methyltransferase domain-containing protein [Bacteroidetes bacterium]|nr:methyltransferase domain-containing protein [Bacteroidota bacterium]